MPTSGLEGVFETQNIGNEKRGKGFGEDCASEGPRGCERTEDQKNSGLTEQRAVGLSRDRRSGDILEDREC